MQNMTLKNIDFSKLLPLWMREDACDMSLATSISNTIKDVSKKIEVFRNIDNMEESELDQMAYEYNITWYRYDVSVEKKREIVKSARKIHRKLGTKWAMEQILTIYFEESKVLEWFEYGGEAGHFKISTINNENVDKNAEAFLKILDTVKRFSQHLDEIEVVESSNMTIAYVIGTREIEKLTNIIMD